MTILAAFVVFNLYSGNYKLSEINIRDPFILTDTVEGRYYMYRTSDSIDSNGKIRGGVEVFMSRDLENWEGPKTVMRIPDGNALTGTVWAPEVHAYNGQYYLFATINSDVKWKKVNPAGAISLCAALRYFIPLHRRDLSCLLTSFLTPPT